MKKIANVIFDKILEWNGNKDVNIFRQVITKSEFLKAAKVD